MLNIIGDGVLIRIGFALSTQPGFQMVLDDLVSCSSFGLPALIYAGDSGWFLGAWGFASRHLCISCLYGRALS
jgi:hypothetical protein